MWSLWEFQREAHAAGIQVELRAWLGDSMVNSARNILLGMFMASDCTDLLLIDQDNDWEPGALMKLLRYPVEFVAAAYRTKTDDIEKYPVRWPETQFHVTHPETGLLEAAAVPFGICRMTRSAVEKMTQAYEHLAYVSDLCPELKLWCLFDNELTGTDQPDWKQRKYWGEDFLFCNRWRAIGGKVWVDPEINTGHTGQKRFAGNLGEALRKSGCEVTPDKLREMFAGTDYDALFKQALGEAA
jgi:hypothetical protein